MNELANGSDAGPIDVIPLDAGVDAPPDAPCALWYLDDDGDGHGAGAGQIACSKPTDHVASDDDCDDNNRYRFPGRAEACDNIDNDCNAGTADVCPAQCTVAKRPPPDDARIYLFCNVAMTWVGADDLCAMHSYDLVQIDSAAENTYVRATADTLIGAQTLFIGANDRTTEGLWEWDNETAFWSNGVTIPGKFALWDTGEPNGQIDDGEDCGNLKTNGSWNDDACSTMRPFVCRR
ncbi:MAG: lectin-like protein [Kofleriaceae bacterium]